MQCSESLLRTSYSVKYFDCSLFQWRRLIRVNPGFRKRWKQHQAIRVQGASSLICSCCRWFPITALLRCTRTKELLAFTLFASTFAAQNKTISVLFSPLKNVMILVSYSNTIILISQKRPGLKQWLYLYQIRNIKTEAYHSGLNWVGFTPIITYFCFRLNQYCFLSWTNRCACLILLYCCRILLV